MPTVYPSRPAALTLVERLRNHELVCRLPSPHDRRMIELYTSRPGRDFVEHTHDETLAIINTVFQTLIGNNSFSFDQALHEFIRAAANSTHQLLPICLHCGAQHTDACPLAKTSVCRP